MGLCNLCQLHQHLTTGPFTFWVEWDNEGLPRLVTDSEGRGGATHALQIVFCPLCGRRIPAKTNTTPPAAEKGR